MKSSTDPARRLHEARSRLQRIDLQAITPQTIPIRAALQADVEAATRAAIDTPAQPSVNTQLYEALNALWTEARQSRCARDLARNGLRRRVEAALDAARPLTQTAPAPDAREELIDDLRAQLERALRFIDWYRRMTIEGQITATDYAITTRPHSDYQLSEAMRAAILRATAHQEARRHA